MKENKILFINILFFIFLGYYTSVRYGILYIKDMSVFSLLGLTLIYGIRNYKKISKKDLKLSIKIFFNLFFIIKYYLSFYLLLISKGVKRKKRIFYFLLINIFFYLLTILLDNLGIIQGDFFYRRTEAGIVERNDLGFGHPNTAMMALLPIFFSMYYLWYDRNKFKILGVILIFSQVIYKLTNSRTGYIVVIIFLVLIIMKDKYLHRLKYFIYGEVFFLLYFSIVLSTKLKTTVFNKILSGRFWLFDYYLNNQRITLFGNREIEKLYKILPLDNTYIRILFEHGIIGLIVSICLILYVFRLLYKYRDYKAIRIFIVILIFGIMEGQAFYYYFNIIYLIIYEYLINKGKE